MPLFSSHPRSNPKRLLILVVLFAVSVACVYPLYLSNVRLQRRVRLMRTQVLILQPLLSADPRFLSIRSSGSSTGGALYLTGPVDTPLAFDDLARLVRDTHPPVPVYIEVQVPCRVAAEGQPLLIPVHTWVGAPEK